MECAGGATGWSVWQHSGDIQQGTKLVAKGVGAVHAHINAATGAHPISLSCWVNGTGPAIANLEADCFCSLRSEIARYFQAFGCHDAQDCESFYKDHPMWASFQLWAASSKDGKCEYAY